MLTVGTHRAAFIPSDAKSSRLPPPIPFVIDVKQQHFIMQLVSLLLYAVVADCATTTLSNLDNWSNERVHWYTRAAIELIELTDCETACFAATEQCNQLKTRLTHLTLVNVYSAESSVNERFIASLPDYESDEHDDILVIDPYPDRPFGHVIAMFYVDNVPENECRWLEGNYIGNLDSTGRCVHWAKNKNCGNSRTDRKENRRPNGCAVDFLPAVFATGTTRSREETGQRLKCRSVPGFARCPPLVVSNGIKPCDSPACEHDLLKQLEPHCGLFEKCDHAVIVQGDWTAASSTDDRMAQMRAALSGVGFEGANLRVFDRDRTLVEANADLAVFPASKRLVRKAISAVCQLHYCVDSFVVVLKAPSLANGDLLLWDANGNGRADTDEKYSLSELLDDLDGCGAAQTIVLVDSPRGHHIISAIERHLGSEPIIAYGASSGSSLSEFSNLWTNARLSDRCVDDLFKTTSVNGKPLDRKTIFGAPCNRRLDERQLAEYRGCHSVPTYEFFRSSNSPALPRRSLRHNRRRTRTK